MADVMRYWYREDTDDYAPSTDDLRNMGYREVPKRPEYYVEAYKYSAEQNDWVIDKTRARSVVSDVRYAHETEGVKYNDNYYESTDRGKALIINAVVKCMRTPEKTFDWKTVEGKFVTLNAEEINGIQDAITVHVDACFARERAIIESIAAGTFVIEDIDKDWPEPATPPTPEPEPAPQPEEGDGESGESSEPASDESAEPETPADPAV